MEQAYLQLAPTSQTVIQRLGIFILKSLGKQTK